MFERWCFCFALVCSGEKTYLLMRSEVCRWNVYEDEAISIVAEGASAHTFFGVSLWLFSLIFRQRDGLKLWALLPYGTRWIEARKCLSLASWRIRIFKVCLNRIWGKNYKWNEGEAVLISLKKRKLCLDLLSPSANISDEWRDTKDWLTGTFECHIDNWHL